MSIHAAALTGATPLARYLVALRNMPASGGGGAHVALLSVANRGRHAGLPPERVVQDLQASVHGPRRIGRAEILAAVKKAYTASPMVPRMTTAQEKVVDGHKLFDITLKRGAGLTEPDLLELSPVQIDWPPDFDAIEALPLLYRPDDLVFIGGKYDSGAEHIRPVAEWVKLFERGTAVPEHVVPNPLTGRLGHTKEGKPSYRADSCVACFKFAVGEFDGIPRAQQIEFWAGVPLPLVALVDSGGKSVHGWVKIDAGSAEEWEHRVENKLFTLLTAVGADGACRNESRLSRTPGHFRLEKRGFQRILYLDPIGRPIIP